MNESHYSQDEQYSSDVSDHSVTTQMNNALNSLQSEEEENEMSPKRSVSKPSSSKVEKVSMSAIFYMYKKNSLSDV